MRIVTGGQNFINYPEGFSVKNAERPAKMLKPIPAIFIVIIIFLSGFFFGRSYNKPEVIIKKEIQYETKWKAAPVTTDDLKLCFDSQLLIDNKIINNTMYIHAYDACKETDKEVQLEIKSDGNWKFYVGLGMVIAGSIAIALRR